MVKCTKDFQVDRYAASDGEMERCFLQDGPVAFSETGYHLGKHVA